MEEKKQENSTSMHLMFCKQVDEILRKYSTKNAVTYMRNSGDEDKLTFQMIAAFIHGAKKEFDRIGLVSGDRAAIISPHSPWAVFMGMALAYSGITIALIDASLPQEEIESLLDYSDVRAVFTTQALYDRFPPSIVEKLPFFRLEGLEILPFNKEQADCVCLPESKDGDEDVIAILYSSGTTGQMKGIMVTYESVLKAREVFVRLSGLKDYMTYMLVLPFNHIAGFTGAMTFFLTGCEIGFIEDVNASKLQNGLTKFQPYYFAMVPKVYEVMEQKIRAAIRAKGISAERLMNTLFKISKFFRKNFGINIGRKMFHNITAQVFGENIFGIGTGASPCKPETAEFFLNLGLEWANLYATTETSVPIVATGIMDRYPVGTVGNVHYHPEIQIKIGYPDQNGIGEILVRSQLMMKGYFKRPDLTAEAFEDGYFKTGDYGYIDRKGYLHITGRIKESVILQNGKKVSPSDVDDYYQERLPDYDIASRGIAVQNGSYDELHLFVANQNYSAAEQSAVRAAIKQVSASAPDMYKLSDIHFVSAILRTSVGKVKRFCLTMENVPAVQAESTKKSSSPDQLVAIIQKHCKAQQVSMNSKLRDDLGMDSLNMFEIVCAIDDEFHVDISSELDGVVTVGDVCELLTKTSTKESMRYPKPKDAKTIQRLKRWIRSVRSIYKIDIQGAENIPDNGNYIICANHQSYFDPLWILASMKNKVDLNKICCMAAMHTMDGKASKKLFDALGGIPVDRSGNTIPAMNCAKKCLKNGDVLIVFPEGARSRDGSMLPFKNGAAKLAIDTNTRILPVRIEGAFEVYPRWNKYPHFFDWKHGKKYRITISFRKMIDPSCVQPNDLMLQVKESISNHHTPSDHSINVPEFIDYQLRKLLDLNQNAKITGDMRLKSDLGMDSLNMFELCVSLDEKYHVSIASHLHDGITVSEIVKLMQNQSSTALSADDTANYPIERTDKDYRSFNRFMKLSEFIWKIEVAGEENINPNEQYIFCPNHESHFDGTWIIGMLDEKFKRTICSVAADYLFEKKVYRKGVIRMGGIPVHRTGNAAPALKRALECISNEGNSLLIHPEGTRTRNGEMGEFKHGAAKLSIESGVKIVPICISGAREIFPPHRAVPRLFDWRHCRRYTIKITYGQPTAPDGMAVDEITEKIRQQIIDMKEQSK